MKWREIWEKLAPNIFVQLTHMSPFLARTVEYLHEKLMDL